jgi:hypothetical protein
MVDTAGEEPVRSLDMEGDGVRAGIEALLAQELSKRDDLVFDPGRCLVRRPVRSS